MHLVRRCNRGRRAASCSVRVGIRGGGDCTSSILLFHRLICASFIISSSRFRWCMRWLIEILISHPVFGCVAFAVDRKNWKFVRHLNQSFVLVPESRQKLAKYQFGIEWKISFAASSVLRMHSVPAISFHKMRLGKYEFWSATICEWEMLWVDDRLVVDSNVAQNATWIFRLFEASGKERTNKSAAE